MTRLALVSLERNPLAERWLAFDAASRRCIVRSGKVELGHGILTAVAQIAAEGLGVSLEEVVVVSGDTAAGPDEGWTAGSASTEQSGQALYAVCALARCALEECRSRHGPGATYWTCSADVLERTTALIGQALREPARLPQLKRQGDWVGRPAARLGWTQRLQGGGFIQDLSPAELLHARTLRPANPLARVAAADMEGLRRLAGVQHVVQEGSFVAIAGQDEAALVRALPAAHRLLRWTAPRLPSREEALGPLQPLEIDGARTVSLTLERGFLTSASIGTSTGIAIWHEHGAVRLEVWTHSQGVFALRGQLALAHRLELESVVVRHVPHAGCYGHNGADDAAYEASLIARQVPGRPVRLVWTREEELAWSPLGSAMRVQVAAGLDSTGKVGRWEVLVTSGTHANRPGWADGVRFVSAGMLAQPWPAGSLTDLPEAMGWGGTRNAWPYYFPDLARVDHVLRPMALRTSSLRALGAHINVAATESAMDELAGLAGEDPLAFRLRHLEDERARAVLRRAACMADWQHRHDSDLSWGLAFARYKNKAAYMAVVVALDLSQDVQVRHVWAAVDAGLVVNPDGVRNQVEGGIVQAMSWTLREEVVWDADGVTTSDWESYPIAKFRDAPRIDVELLEAPLPEPLGVGEVACGPTAAAITNALAAGLGVRLAQMPFTRERIFSALA